MKYKYYKILRFVYKAVRVFDVFGVPIQFNFDGQESYKSFFGGISTVIVTFLIVVSFQSQIRSFSNRETIYFETNSIFNSNPLQMTLNSSNFMFAIKVEQSVGQVFNQKPYFNIILTQQNYTNVNGTTIRYPMQLDFEPCKLENFQGFGDTLEQSFNTNNIAEFICPTNSTQLLLQGSYLNEQFNFARIQVQTCSGYTNQKYWNVSCANESDITNYLQQNGQFRLALYTSNYVVNPTKSNGYSEIYLAEDLNFLFQPNYMKQQVNVYFKEYEMNTDESLFINQDIKSETYIFRNEETYKLENVLNIQNNTNQSPLTIYFRSDFFRETASRRFQKIDQLLAYFGGIFNIFLLVFGILVKWYNATFYKMKMANRLYQYSDLKNNKDKIQIKFENTYNYQGTLDLENVNNITFLSMKGFKTKLEYLYFYFKNYVIKSQKVYPGISYIIYLITFRKKFKTITNQLVDKSLNQINEDSNVRILIKKVQEIEKLKQITLNEYQLQIFNFIQRPNLSLDDQISETTQLKTTLSSRIKVEKNQNHFSKLIQAYNIIQKEIDNNNQLSQNLLQFLGEEMMKLLDLSIKAEEENTEGQQQEPQVGRLCQSNQVT